MVRMSPQTRRDAARAIAQLTSGGGTAIGTWLDLAGQLFFSVPQVIQRHAILLTDGENNESAEVLGAAINRATGVYQVDARGVGTDWKVEEVRRIATQLLGTVDIVPSRTSWVSSATSCARRWPAGRRRRAAGVDAQGAQILFVRQVSPTVEDLTAGGAGQRLTGGYPTGAWADESRTIVSVRLSAKALGQERCRVQLVINEQVHARAWSRRSGPPTTRSAIDEQVAHYTGQTELAAAIQEGLAAKAMGDDATATAKLGRAVQLAEQTGNDEATAKLRKVVDVDDAETGTVRLKKAVDKADEMELDTASTKTTRIRKEG